MTQRICTHCKKTKKQDHFPPWGHNRQGKKVRSSFCHECMLARRRRYYQTKSGREAIKRANKRYFAKKKAKK